MCPCGHTQYGDVPGRIAGSNSNPLMPAEMQAGLKPLEVNCEVSKEVNEDQTEPKYTNAGGRKKTCILSMEKLILVPFLSKDA